MEHAVLRMARLNGANGGNCYLNERKESVHDMIRPDTGQIEKLAKEYPILPVCREIYADVTTTMTLLRRLSAPDRAPLASDHKL